VASYLVIYAALTLSVDVSISSLKVRSLEIKSSPGYPAGLIGIASIYLLSKVSHNSSAGYCLPNIYYKAVCPTT